MAIDMAKEIAKILDEEVERVNKEVNDAVLKVADAAVKELQESSPKKSGKYAKSWKKKEEQLATGSKSATIYNEKHYRLTHLLEFGHATVDGKRVPAHPHIAAVEQKVIKDFEEEIRRGIENG
jgi:hypothetical protein|nr:MAG TPA: putative tail component [Caudoviricetes sp.]